MVTHQKTVLPKAWWPVLSPVSNSELSDGVRHGTWRSPAHIGPCGFPPNTSPNADVLSNAVPTHTHFLAPEHSLLGRKLGIPEADPLKQWLPWPCVKVPMMLWGSLESINTEARWLCYTQTLQRGSSVRLLGWLHLSNMTGVLRWGNSSPILHPGMHGHTQKKDQETVERTAIYEPKRRAVEEIKLEPEPWTFRTLKVNSDSLNYSDYSACFVF